MTLGTRSANTEACRWVLQTDWETSQQQTVSSEAPMTAATPSLRIRGQKRLVEQERSSSWRALSLCSCHITLHYIPLVILTGPWAPGPTPIAVLFELGPFSSCLPNHYSIMSSLPSGGSSAPRTPPRPSSVRYLSPASLNLERVYAQNRARLQQREGTLSPSNDPASLNAGKGKPRLLLMGQRRYDPERKDVRVEGARADRPLQEREIIYLKRRIPQSTA